MTEARPMDEPTLARAIHDYMHLDSENECDAPMDAGEIAKRYTALAARSEPGAVGLSGNTTQRVRLNPDGSVDYSIEDAAMRDCPHDGDRLCIDCGAVLTATPAADSHPVERRGDLLVCTTCGAVSPAS